MSEKMPSSEISTGGTGGSILFFGAKDVIKFVGIMIVSVITIGIYPAIVICKKK